MKRLGAGTQRLLDEGSDEMARHQLMAALVNGMVAARWTDDEIEACFESRLHAGVRQVGSRSGGQVKYPMLGDAARRMAAKTRVRHDDWSRRIHEERCQFVLNWRQNAGHDVAFRAYLGLLQIAEIAGRATFTASLRQIAEAAGVGSFSVSHKVPMCDRTIGSWNSGSDVGPLRGALVKLTDLGMLKIDSTCSGRRSRDATTTYTLQALSLSTHTIPSLPRSSAGDLTRARELIDSRKLLHPVWERQRESFYLGVPGCRIWHALLLATEGMTQGALVQATGYGRATVHRTLNERLIEWGLVERAQPRGPWQAVDADLDELADKLGLAVRPFARAEANKHARRMRFLHIASAEVPPSMVDYKTGELIELRRPIEHRLAGVAQGLPSSSGEHYASIVTHYDDSVDASASSELARAS